MNLTQIGRFITKRRTELGLTQLQLAEKLGVTDRAVSKWERGKNLPDTALLSPLAAELRTSIVEILSGDALDTAKSSNLDRDNVSGEDIISTEKLTLQKAEAGDLMVSPYLFGCNLEHTRSCLFTGLSAQLLRNRKFVGKPTAQKGCAMEWYPLGENAVFYLDSEAPYTRHGEGYHMHRLWALECNALRVLNPDGAGIAGIGQHELAILKNGAYLFAMVVKTTCPVRVRVSLTDRAGNTVYASGEILADASDWTRYEIELCSECTDPEADLRILWETQAGVAFGALSLLPKDNFRGMRRDVIRELSKLGVKVIRWPGGNFAGEFNWMDGFLPVDMRAPFKSALGLETQPHTAGYDFSEINTDDFIALCREVGAEPFITLNPAWNTPEENAAWVEYCNGDVSTKYGALRASRGSEEPYGVQFWSLGNEFGYGHMEGDNTPAGYCKIVSEHGKKMLEVTPNLSLCSSGPYPNDEWAEFSARPLSEIAKLVSLHDYAYEPKYTDPATFAEEYRRCLASISRLRSLIQRTHASLKPDMRISMDEWNVWYAWYRPTNVTDGIFAALALHLLIDENEPSGIALACHFQAVNEGLISVSPYDASLTAQGQIFSMMQCHAGGHLLYSAQDAVVTSDNEGTVSATLINASFGDERPVDFSAYGPCKEALLFSSDKVLPPSRFTETDVTETAAAGVFTMPPHSVLKLTF